MINKAKVYDCSIIELPVNHRGRGNLMENKLISIIVCTYNNIDGLIPTLESIRLQTYKEIELIISDDGSENNLVSIVEDYLDKYKNSFKFIHFIKHEKNIGSVKNIQNAIKNTNGEIIKGISPGDLLYSSDTLNDINIFFNKHHPLIACGYPRSYTKINNEIIDKYVYNYYTYKDLFNNKKTLYNMIFGEGYITGASLIYSRKLFFEKNYFLPEIIKYLDDFVQVWITLDKIRIYNMNKFIVWYEYGSGISTSDNRESKAKMRKDYLLFYRWIQKRMIFGEHTYKMIKINNVVNDENSSSLEKLFYLIRDPYCLLKKITLKYFRKIYNKLRLNKIIAQEKTFILNQGDGFKEIIIESPSKST
jgi:alpha-1,3-rhamnosyltransferase